MSQQPTQDFTQVTSAKEDTLPRWNFSKFYSEVDAPEFEADTQKLEQWSADFAARYEGKIATLDGDQLAAAIAESKAMGDLGGKLGTYLSLKQTQDSKKYTPAAEAFSNRTAPLGARGAFFTHEIKQLGETAVQAMLAQSEALRKYAPWLERVRKAIPHTPPLDVTRYSSELSADEGVVNLYDKWHAAKRYSFEGEQLNETEILDIITNDKDRARRKAAHDTFIAGLKQDSMLMAHLYNERIRLQTVDDKWTNDPQPWDGRHRANNVTAAMVDALAEAARDSYAPVMQRFYALKAKLLGQDKLEIFDRNVNPFELKSKEKTYIPFAKAQDMVVAAYRRFSPQVADIVQKFFDGGWIDAPVDKNKRGGAFASPGASRLAQPMVMLNYKGSPRDVATMAHELGHGAHQFLAAFKGDAIVSSPLTFAETASVFGEMLTFKSLLAQAGSDDERRRMLCEKVNDMINTVFRQISFHNFEKRCHTAFREENRPLTEEELAQNFYDSVKESYGETINLPDDYGIAYSYIGHFMHVPFYVYAYAFGDALVNALYQVYEDGSVPDFEQKYIKMLEMGGTLTAKDLKEMFGLDIEDPGFWKKGLRTIETMVDELEKLCEPLLQSKAQPAPAP